MEQELLASIRYIWIARHWKTIKFLNKSSCRKSLSESTCDQIFCSFFPQKNFCLPPFLNIDFSSGCAPTKVQVLQFVPIWAQFVSWKPTLTHRENLLRQWLSFIIIHQGAPSRQDRSWGYTNSNFFATTMYLLILYIHILIPTLIPCPSILKHHTYTIYRTEQKL